ncbi:MAG: YIP1 family protein [Chloroflexi bacterium]|nr:YIP1 family protein [Chloroflexota bacterium]
MADTLSPAPTSPRRFHFDWLIPALFRPRSTFAAIGAYSGSAWLTPLLVLALTGLLRVAAAAPIQLSVSLSEQESLPLDFQYYSPEQQAQLQQATQATSGPIFVYVFPAITAVGGVWAGWLVVVGLLHLILTMLGGRGSTRATMNVAAWAALPFAVRDLVRVGAMVATHQLVSYPGLSGFAPEGGGFALYVGELLKQVDVYWLWQAALLALGSRITDNLASSKTWGGVAVTLLIVSALLAVPGFIVAQFSALTAAQPLF